MNLPTIMNIPMNSISEEVPTSLNTPSDERKSRRGSKRVMMILFGEELNPKRRRVGVKYPSKAAKKRIILKASSLHL